MICAAALSLRNWLKLTSYSTLKSNDQAGVGRNRIRDMSGERCSGLKPGPNAEDE